MDMDELEKAKILNYILGTLVLVLTTFILNFGLGSKPQPKQIQNNTIQEIKIEKAEPEVEKQEIILVNLNNREKAALFLLIPFFCMVLWFILNGLKGIVKNYRNRDSVIHFK